MDWGGWAVFGFGATVALTAIMVGGQLVGITRMDIPLILGTIVVEDPDKARVAGFFIHLFNGQAFALLYAVAFALLDRATWWLGALFGAFHGAAVLTLVMPLIAGAHPRMASERSGPQLDLVLEPPGFLALNYGRESAVVTFLAHVIFGVLLGIFLQPK